MNFNALEQYRIGDFNVHKERYRNSIWSTLFACSSTCLYFCPYNLYVRPHSLCVRPHVYILVHILYMFVHILYMFVHILYM